MKILVTGGAGFIGSYLVEELVKQGNEVVVVDNLHRGRKSNLSEVIDRIEFVEQDISEPLDRLVEGCDLVYHLAAISQVAEAVKNPDMCKKYNVTGTANVADACEKNQAKLIFASSREVYGDAEVPVKEDQPLKPKNPYASSKAEAESIIQEKVQYVILRIANVIGQRDFGRVTPIFIENCLKGSPLKVRGDKVLDFIHVSDVVSALIKSQEVSGKILNIGSGTGTSLRDLAQKIREMTGSSSEIILEESGPEEVGKFIADISRAREALKWEPRTSLDDALKKLIE